MVDCSDSSGRILMHARGSVDDPRGIELSSAVDDADNPSRFTVFLDDEIECLTHWITIDYEYAVGLHEFA